MERHKELHEEVRAVGSNLGEASHGNFSSNIRDWWLPRWLVRFRGELVGGAVLTAHSWSFRSCGTALKLSSLELLRFMGLSRI